MKMLNSEMIYSLLCTILLSLLANQNEISNLICEEWNKFESGKSDFQRIERSIRSYLGWSFEKRYNKLLFPGKIDCDSQSDWKLKKEDLARNLIIFEVERLNNFQTKRTMFIVQCSSWPDVTCSSMDPMLTGCCISV